MRAVDADALRKKIEHSFDDYEGISVWQITNILLSEDFSPYY